MPEWINKAQAQLMRLLGERPGWGYRPSTEPCVEPTVLASLGLLAGASPDGLHSVIRRASDWLASIQQPDGSIGLSASLPAPNWPTAHALLLWSAAEDYSGNRSKAAAWLLREQGLTFPIDSKGVIGHDTSIPGWPWVSETHSWIEPTAMAVMALRRQGLSSHPRVRDGLKLIRNRAIANGGWNCGSNRIYGTELRALPAPTGIALVALAGLHPRDPIVDKACSYLQAALQKIRSPQSLSWGLMGLSAWGKRPAESSLWLEESFERAMTMPDPGIQLAYLLLANGEKSLDLLGGGGVR